MPLAIGRLLVLHAYGPWVQIHNNLTAYQTAKLAASPGTGTTLWRHDVPLFTNCSLFVILNIITSSSEQRNFPYKLANVFVCYDTSLKKLTADIISSRQGILFCGTFSPLSVVHFASITRPNSPWPSSETESFNNGNTTILFRQTVFVNE